MNNQSLPEILVLTSYPPRECGIATYSYDLVNAIQKQYHQSFKINVCALETDIENYGYWKEVKFVLNTTQSESYVKLAHQIKANGKQQLVFLQHEFGFFKNHEDDLIRLLKELAIPVLITFHTVLPHPTPELLKQIVQLSEVCDGIVVMTNNAAKILVAEYGIKVEKITVVAHGTHLVKHLNQSQLKNKYGYNGRTILSTFGLISSGKSIETTLEALPKIVELNPEVLFLIIGKTHPGVISHEGEKYRLGLADTVKKLNLSNHVSFVNQYLPTVEVLEYLQLTDIYLFTSKDRSQAVSGTFVYALSCGCPIISTPIPHAIEVLKDEAGILYDFEDTAQLQIAIETLLKDTDLRKKMSLNGLHTIASTSWENSAIAHVNLFERFAKNGLELKYAIPPINLAHIQQLTTDIGMIQFSKINHPDLESGYTLDDNARAMIAMIMHYEISGSKKDLKLIETYFKFIQYCIQYNGRFLNYVNESNEFTIQNGQTNLDDSNGRAIWALGFLCSHSSLFEKSLIQEALTLLEVSMQSLFFIHSPRALAFSLKGLYYLNEAYPSLKNRELATTLANRLVQMYAHESESGWNWFESYLTYGNSVLPEGMLCAYKITSNEGYKIIAKTSFDFLIANTFSQSQIKLVSNKSWLHKGKKSAIFGEQPIDVAYTIMALERFYEEFESENYSSKMEIAFNWFLGNNHLHQIIYNPCTGGCYDGLEETHVNLNQGAESTVSYLLSRLTIDKVKALPIHTKKRYESQMATA